MKGRWQTNAGAYHATVGLGVDGKVSEEIRNCQFRFRHPIIASQRAGDFVISDADCGERTAASSIH